MHPQQIEWYGCALNTPVYSHVKAKGYKVMLDVMQ